MRATGNQYFRQHKMADAQVTSAVGFNNSDRKYIERMKHVKQAEYSIYRDALTADSQKTIRLNEKTAKLSVYKAVQGRLPHKSNEIALSKYEKNNYKIGQQISLVDNQGKKQIAGLRYHKYKIVGFVTSSDYLQKDNLGVSNAGKGQIDTFGVLTKLGFSEQTPNVAKISYDNLRGQSYSDQFEKRLNKNIDQAAPILAKRADKRQLEIKKQKQTKIKNARTVLGQQKTSLFEQQTKLDWKKKQLELAAVGVKDSQQQLAGFQDQLQKMPAGSQKDAQNQQLQMQRQQAAVQIA